MAHVRQDTLKHPRGWEKHLRPFGKRDQAGRERQAAKHAIIQDVVTDTESGSLRRDMTPREVSARKADLELLKAVKKKKVKKKQYWLRAHIVMRSDEPINRRDIKHLDSRIVEVTVDEFWDW